MPKRKRGEDGSASASASASAQRGASKHRRLAEQQVQHGQTLLFRAFKAAKGFERQKLSRRSKTATASKDDREITRINGEIEAIKHLDLAKAAASYLHKSLMKIKAIAQHPALPPSLTIPPAQPSDAATLNVIARLCNSNPVKSALPNVLAGIESALGIVISKPSASAKATKARSQAHDRELANGHAESGSGGEHDDSTFSDAEANFELAGSESDDFADFDERLASSDSDDDGEESNGGPRKPAFDPRLLLKPSGGSIDSAEEEEYSSGSDNDIRKATRSRLARRQLSASPSASPSRSPEPQPRPRKIGDSAFLPTLTMGGYISGSDSDPLEDPEALSGVKKNRRGQRARQAIWEKKYGQEAKHVKRDSANGGKKARDAGWDPKRGATDGGRRDRRAPGGRDRRGNDRGRSRQNGERTGANDIALGKPKHRDDGGKLHPSWEAAKKRKEAGDKPATAAFSGKKITFT